MSQIEFMFAKELIIDNFAGGGGASLGIEQAFGRSVDIAINHDKEAVAMHTATTKPRFGLVTVAGTDYVIADIGMRMLKPRELYRAQGFPDTYKIDIEVNGKRLSQAA